MINKVSNGDQGNSQRSSNNYKVKNEYTWKEQGGGKLLQNLCNDESEEIESDTMSGMNNSILSDEPQHLFGKETMKYIEKERYS